MKMLKLTDYLPDDVARTLLVPLWACAQPCGRFRPSIRAQAAIAQIDYDFTALARASREYAVFCCRAREQWLDRRVAAFIRRCPRGVIVNLGCGLSTAAFRTPLVNCRWYDLDLPEVIRLREQLMPPEPGQSLIARSLLDFSWMNEIDFNPENGILFLAAGVFYYFRDNQLRPLVSEMARRFPGGQLIFDATTGTGLGLTQIFLWRAGLGRAAMQFSVSDLEDLEHWSPLVHARIQPYFDEELPDELSIATRLAMSLGQFFGMLKTLRLDFAEARK